MNRQPPQQQHERRTAISDGLPDGSNSEGWNGNLLEIVQYNAGRLAISKAVFDQLNPAKQLVTAIQEPRYNKQTKRAYCPLGYHILMTASEDTRVAFLVSKDLGLDIWEWVPVSNFVAKLRIKTATGWINIINVYNPRENGRVGNQPILRAEQAIEGGAETILLGDLNLHHPQWGGVHVAPDPEAVESYSTCATDKDSDYLPPQALLHIGRDVREQR